MRYVYAESTTGGKKKQLDLAGCNAEIVQQASVDVVRLLYNPRSAAGWEHGTLQQLFSQIIPDDLTVVTLL